jgi:uncharacterized membrane protein YqjE
MTSEQPKTSIRTMANALLAQGSLYGQLAWIELRVEKARLMRMMLLLLAGFSLLTSLLVSLSALLLLVSWDTPARIPVLIIAGLVYCAGFIGIWLGITAQLRKGEQAFSDTREELAEDLELLRSRLKP